jgi:hypothetical protein
MALEVFLVLSSMASWWRKRRVKDSGSSPEEHRISYLAEEWFLISLTGLDITHKTSFLTGVTIAHG